MSGPEQYARAVLDGRLPACELVRCACRRFLRDLELGGDRGLRFDAGAGARATEFFRRFLVHSKGEWAGRPLELELWQRFVVEQLFGWRRGDGSRRFRMVYAEVPRKNGKSTMVAGVGLYCLVSDAEAGAEIYSAATSRDQALIVFEEAQRMVKRSPALLRHVKPYRRNLHVLGTASKFEPLSSDYNTLDGLNVHCAIVDELHAHPNRNLWDVIDTATGARRQPIVFGITTAGQEATSFCGQQHDYAEQVLRGTIEDDAYLVYIATIDDGDDWKDEACWPKANPNLAVSVKLDDLREKCRRAQANPAAQNSFRRLRLNQWVTASTRYVDLARWDACAGSLNAQQLEEAIAPGRQCYAGIDLSSTTDLTATAYVFPPEALGDPFDVVMRFYMPEARALDREARDRDRVPYDAWVEQGWITATPGEVVDYEFVERDLLEFAERYVLDQLGFDPWNATGFTSGLQENHGIVCVTVRQGYASMSEPTKQFDRLYRSARIRHGGHPVLRWMAHNLVVATDAAGNVKPNKERSRGRIDGLVALIMALDRAIRNEAAGAPGYPGGEATIV